MTNDFFGLNSTHMPYESLERVIEKIRKTSKYSEGININYGDEKDIEKRKVYSANEAVDYLRSFKIKHNDIIKMEGSTWSGVGITKHEFNLNFEKKGKRFGFVINYFSQ